ncbi:2',3'-cyclic-nucleotide 2'-phosphodiesterase [Sinisalibacter aestuarii]|uniref:2',3'-cyclic-nucleotide 2'-phosphodiesterase n=1 Tax=Sinisalibacter aestuarii TaxID=2949426 RepID=A0ABQ5LMJ8_9RHOB|nr:2',3'-cyclic-nucleotide 2'-phosphodiesterase [Sinisalibacter aestuarii]
MHILPYDYLSNMPSVTTGLARTASLIRAARAQADNALLFDNGDFLHGNPMGDAVLRDVMRGRRELRGRHPIVAAMAALGVDAITLGNHDFDHGAEYLGHVLAHAPFPVVISNLSLVPRAGPAGPRPIPASQPFALIERWLTDTAGKAHKVTIGLLGFLPPGSITGLRGSAFRAEIRDIVATAEIAVPQLRALGADLVVILAHSGIGPATHRPGMENALLPLARIPGIDAIVGGHAHQVFPRGDRADWPAGADPQTGRIHGTPTVVPGFWGSHLGVIDLSLTIGPKGVTVQDARIEARPISLRNPASGETRPTVAPDRAILRMLNNLHRTIIGQSQHSCGETRHRLHSYFAAAAPSPALDVVHRALDWWVARELADGPLAHLPRLTATAPFKAGGRGGPGYYTDIPPGPITRHGVTDLYLYPNTLCILRMTGAELSNWLERSASVFNRIRPFGGDQPLLDPTTPLYTFETLAGCDYEIDLSVEARFAPDGTLRTPRANRIRNLTVDGQRLGMSDEVLLATTTYRAAGRGGYPAPAPERIAFEPGHDIREIIAAYLAETGPVDGPLRASWRFGPVPGATALFASSPQAAEVVEDAPALSELIRPGPLLADGFRSYRLALGGRVSYIAGREVGAGKHLANPVRSGRKQP